MEKSGANNFLILFRDSGCQFRSLYTYCPDTEEINKLAGIGPKTILRKMIDGLYKYNSDRKQFSQIPAKPCRQTSTPSRSTATCGRPKNQERRRK